MKRRNLLRASGVVASLSVAGCLGYTIEDEDDVQQRQDRIEELEGQVEDLETQIGDLDAEIGEKESEIEQLESDLDERTDEIEGLESDVARLRAEKVSSLYALGHARIEAANESIDDADQAGNAEDWQRASSFWLRAEGELNGAHAAFEDARIVADEEGLTDVSGTIEDARLWANHMSEACLNLANAFLYLERGEDSTAQEYTNAAEQELSLAENYDVADPVEIESALGL